MNQSIPGSETHERERLKGRGREKRRSPSEFGEIDKLRSNP